MFYGLGWFICHLFVALRLESIQGGATFEHQDTIIWKMCLVPANLGRLRCLSVEERWDTMVSRHIFVSRFAKRRLETTWDRYHPLILVEQKWS